MWRGLLAVTVCAFAGGAFAQSALIEYKVDPETNDAVVVKADRGSYDPGAGIGRLVGSVVIESGEIRVRSQTATVHEDPEVTGLATKLLFEGNVRIDAPDMEATAERGTYLVQENLLLLRGSVTLRTERAILSGEELTYNTETRVATLGKPPNSASGGN